MKRSFSAWFVLFAALGVVALAMFACGDLEEYYTRSNNGRFTRHTKGGAIDISEDDTRVVVVNRDTGSLSVLEPTYGAADEPLKKLNEVVHVCNDIEEGDHGEPWQVALTPNGETAFVVCRSEQVVVEVIDIKKPNTRLGRRVSVGSEPTGIALTPRATAAWVANWVDGTLMRIDTAKMSVTDIVDLNAALVSGGYLGAVKSRKALAHPRSIAITNDGDDDESDESLVVTEYFSQQKEILADDGQNADSARVGILYKLPLASAAGVKLIELSVSEMRFPDAKNDQAHCFPNQLQSVTINGSAGADKLFAYVTSVCASPKGPLGIYSPKSQPLPCKVASDCAAASKCVSEKCEESTNGVKTTTSPAITVVDLIRDQTVRFGTVAINFEYSNFYDNKKLAEDSPDRALPLLANDVAFRPGTFRALVSAGGADALFQLDFLVAYQDRPAKVPESGASVNMDIARGREDGLPLGPIGVVAAHSHPHVFVANDGARRVAIVDLDADNGAGRTLAGQEAAELPSAGLAAEKAAKGKRLFNFGRGRWSMHEQGWGACAVCHVDGLTDNVTWFFPRGPRQSSSIDAFFDRDEGGNPTAQRNFGWNAGLDEASDLDNNVLRNMFGGVGAIAKKSPGILSYDDQLNLSRDRGLNGSSMKIAENELDDWKNIVAFLGSVRTPRRPSGLDDAQIQRGFAVAQRKKCGTCHGGALWTVSTLFYDPQRADVDAGPDADARLTDNEKLKTKTWEANTVVLPAGLLPTTEPSARTMRYAGDAGSAFDSLTCALRDVKTFGAKEPNVGVAERRENMTTVAQGGRSSNDPHEPSGYNPPSLLGLSVGAPYFHAGNARTLEAVFADDFEDHRDALEKSPLTPQEREDLIVFLLAIDRSATPSPARRLDVPNGSVFCAKP